MAEIDTQIYMALKERVAKAAGETPVAWPGEPFTPPRTATAPQPFLAVGRIATSTRVVIGSRGPQERTGILSLGYVAPTGKPHEWYLERAALLLRWFPLDGCTCFGSARVFFGVGLSVPRVEAGFQDGGYWRTPILIPWRCAA